MSLVPDDDDRPIGAILNRRDAVRLLAVGSAAFAVGCRPSGQGVSGASTGASTGEVLRTGTSVLPACVAKPELTVGPYFVDKQLERSDIRLEPTTNAMKAGAPFALAFNVQRISGGQCAPLAGAMVDVWQCDAAGTYSGVNDRMEGFDTTGQKFLRGYQITDAGGVARFTTIYPGWYRGRTVHIHFKIRTPAQTALAGTTDGAYEFTSQLFFDDALTDRVHARAPYAAKGQRDLRNQNDGIFREAGNVLLLQTASAAAGYRASFDVGLDLSDAQTGRPDRSGGPGGPGGPPPGGRRPPRPPGA